MTTSEGRASARSSAEDSRGERARISTAPTSLSPEQVRGPAPVLSVILVTSRHPEFVADAIESVRRQTLDRRSFELVVVQDYHNPTLERATVEAQGRSVIVSPGYFGSGLEAGVAASRGEILSFLDDDDCYRPEKLLAVASAFHEDPTLGFYRNGFSIIDSNGHPLPNHPFRAAQRTSGERLGSVTIGGPDRDVKLRELPAVGIDFNSSCISVRRILLQRLISHLRLPGPRLPDELPFFATLASTMSLRVDPSPLTEYRIHQGSISSGSFTEAAPFAARESYSRLAAQSGPPLIDAVRAMGSQTAIDEAEGLWVVQRAYLALRDASTSRSQYLQLRRELGALRRSYLVKCETRLGMALLLFWIAPALGRQLYAREIRSRSS
ncbi:MAG: glycosyltransferase family A protein [Thermoplasmata archaeon]